MQRVGEVVATVLKAMREHARPGMTTKQLDEYGRQLFEASGAESAPVLTYGFPGCTCISLNGEIAHGIPSDDRVMAEGDLVNVDVSAMLDGYWADNGGSFVLGREVHGYLPLVNASKDILWKAIHQLRGGMRISDMGRLIDTEAKKRGYTVIKNLTGHGVGSSLHEEPSEIPNYYDRFNKGRFRKNSVVAIETFISSRSTRAVVMEDGWTLVGNKGGLVAQHEHTVVVTDGNPIILTQQNEIW